VPIKNGQRLFAAMPEPKRFVTVHGGDHNDATPADPVTYWNAVTEFTDSVTITR